MLCDGVQCAGEVEVVGVEPGEDVTRRSVEAVTNCGRLSFVFAGLPVGDVLLVFPDNIRGSVRAAAVDDDELEVRVALVDDGADRLLQELRLVV